MKFIEYVLFGIIMGVANVIPGVSGGTMAVVFNFYDLLIESITIDFKVIKKNLYFLIPFGIGIIVGILGLSKIMKVLFEHYPSITYSAFIGIVLGSIPLIYVKTKSINDKISKFNYVIFIFVLALMLYFSLKDNGNFSEIVKYQSLNMESFIMCFIAMAIAAATMIIPGVSGSMMLLIIGMYSTVYIEIIGRVNIPLLIPSIFGAFMGLFGGAKLITYLLNKYKQSTYIAILALLVGSCFKLFKSADILNQDGLGIVINIVVLLIAFGIIVKFSIFEIKKEKGEK